MTITDIVRERNVSRQSFNCMHTLKILPALALITVPQHAEALAYSIETDVQYEYVSDMTYSTNHVSELEYVKQTQEYKLFQAINDIYDDLLSNQQELDKEAKEILYDNLWDLYD